LNPGQGGGDRAARREQRSRLELVKKASHGLGADDIIVAVGVRDVQIKAQQWLARGAP